jgi:hypothetical protein
MTLRQAMIFAAVCQIAETYDILDQLGSINCFEIACIETASLRTSNASCFRVYNVHSFFTKRFKRTYSLLISLHRNSIVCFFFFFVVCRATLGCAFSNSSIKIYKLRSLTYIYSLVTYEIGMYKNLQACQIT